MTTALTYDYAAAGLSKSDASYVERIAKEIDRKQRHVAETVVQSTIALGRELAAARERFKAENDRGFCKWVTERCGIPKTNAYRFIAAWEAFGDCPTVEQIDLSAVYLLSGQSCPEEVTLQAIERSKEARVTKADAAAMIDAAIPDDDPAAVTFAVDPDPPTPPITTTVPTPREEAADATWSHCDGTLDATDDAGTETPQTCSDAIREALLDVWAIYRDKARDEFLALVAAACERIREDYQ